MYIGCDLFSSSIKFQRIENFVLKNLKKKFKNIKILEVIPKKPQHKILNKIEIYWGNRISSKLIQCMPNLKWIHYASTGFSKEIYNQVLKKNIKVTNTQNMFSNAVASTVFSYIFSLARGVHHCQSLKVEKKLNRKNFDKISENIQDVFNQKILIVGLGGIGKKIAKICKAMGMEISVIKKNANTVPSFIKKVLKLSNLKEAVKDVDYVVNVLPLTEKTNNIFNKNIFKSMKKTSFFINVGRGGTVNEQDLLSAIKAKNLLGAALDVMKEEPVKIKSPFLKQKNVILTPHIAGVTNNYWNDQYLLFSENLIRYKKGLKLINLKKLNNLKEGY